MCSGLNLTSIFSDAGFLPAASGIPFRDLVLEGFSTLPQLDGLTLRQFLGGMNTLLSGGTSIVSIGDIGGPPDFDPILNSLNASFGDGTLSQFAQDHLVAPYCGYSDARAVEPGNTHSRSAPPRRDNAP